MIIFRWSDADKHFHPLSFHFVSGTCGEIYRTCWAFLHKHSTKYFPRGSMSDGAEQISNGFRELYGKKKR